MPRLRHTAEQILRKLRRAEVALSKGEPLAHICRRGGELLSPARRRLNYLRTNLVPYIDKYYNGTRLPSTNQFEIGLAGPPSDAVLMQFFRPAQEEKFRESARTAIHSKFAIDYLSQ